MDNSETAARALGLRGVGALRDAPIFPARAFDYGANCIKVVSLIVVKHNGFYGRKPPEHSSDGGRLVAGAISEGLRIRPEGYRVEFERYAREHGINPSPHFPAIRPRGQQRRDGQRISDGSPGFSHVRRVPTVTGRKIQGFVKVENMKLDRVHLAFCITPRRRAKNG